MFHTCDTFLVHRLLPQAEVYEAALWYIVRTRASKILQNANIFTVCLLLIWRFEGTIFLGKCSYVALLFLLDNYETNFFDSYIGTSRDVSIKTRKVWMIMGNNMSSFPNLFFLSWSTKIKLLCYFGWHRYMGEEKIQVYKC